MATALELGDDEGVPLAKLRSVVGKVVHVSGPLLAARVGMIPPNRYPIPRAWRRRPGIWMSLADQSCESGLTALQSGDLQKAEEHF